VLSNIEEANPEQEHDETTHSGKLGHKSKSSSIIDGRISTGIDNIENPEHNSNQNSRQI
jgi:hypothetical protein